MKNNKQQDLTIIGGGIMGLMTAYFASNFVRNITILEKRTIGKDNQESSSFGFTRSIRNDYLDRLYATMSYEAQLLWKDLQRKSTRKFFIDCGCLNLAKTSITPDLSKTYAEQSYQNIFNLNFETEKFSKSELKKRYPLFDVDLGCLDIKAGFLYLPVITNLLLTLLEQKKVTIIQNVTITQIDETKKDVTIKTDDDIYTSQKVVVTVGRWVNDIMKVITSNKLEFPIILDRPQENKYFYPPKELFDKFLPKNFPVFAYLDVGIYGHPIFDEKKGGLKIGYYNPPDVKKKDNKKIKSVDDFIKECLPVLKTVPSEDVNDVDQCYYDLVGDDNFIIGKLPNYKNIVVGAGWRGTGYKFAPLIGKMLSQLALQNGTVYDIKQFATERFIK